jgi:hypothetical protein
MRKRRFCSVLPFVLVLVFAAAAIAEMSSINYSLKASVLSSGGIAMNSTSYQMTTTIGQSSCIGLSSKRNYISYAGFWQPEIAPREGMFYIIPNKEGGASVIYVE